MSLELDFRVFLVYKLNEGSEFLGFRGVDFLEVRSSFFFKFGFFFSIFFSLWDCEEVEFVIRTFRVLED